MVRDCCLKNGNAATLKKYVRRNPINLKGMEDVSKRTIVSQLENLIDEYESNQHQ